MKKIALLLCMGYWVLNAQSYIGVKYLGGTPTFRLFSRPFDYCAGFSFDRYTEDIMGNTDDHCILLGAQFEGLFSGGIKQSIYLKGLPKPDQDMVLKRGAVGLSMALRYVYTRNELMPYGELTLGFRDFYSHIELSPGQYANPIENRYESDDLNGVYGLGAGFLLQLFHEVKLDMSLNCKFGKRANLYDFNSVSIDQGNVILDHVKVSTSNLQFKVGLLIDVNRPLLRFNGNNFFPNILFMTD